MQSRCRVQRRSAVPAFRPAGREAGRGEGAGGGPLYAAHAPELGHDYARVRIHSDAGAAIQRSIFPGEEMAGGLLGMGGAQTDISGALGSGIGFMGDLLGLGGIGGKVQKTVGTARGAVESGIDTVLGGLGKAVNWGAEQAGGIGGSVESAAGSAWDWLSG